jgi:hypothetical protein
MYNRPSIGTILPGQPNATVSNPGATADQDAVLAWEQAQAQDYAFQQTNLAIANYLNGWPSWLNITYPSLSDPDSPPPTPPGAFVVLVAAAEAQPLDFQTGQSGKAGFGPYIPACAVPSYTKHAPPANPANNVIAAPTSAAVTIVPVAQYSTVVASNGQTYLAVTPKP